MALVVNQATGRAGSNLDVACGQEMGSKLKLELRWGLPPQTSREFEVPRSLSYVFFVDNSVFILTFSRQLVCFLASLHLPQAPSPPPLRPSTPPLRPSPPPSPRSPPPQPNPGRKPRSRQLDPRVLVCLLRGARAQQLAALLNALTEAGAP